MRDEWPRILALRRVRPAMGEARRQLAAAIVSLQLALLAAESEAYPAIEDALTEARAAASLLDGAEPELVSLGMAPRRAMRRE